MTRNLTPCECGGEPAAKSLSYLRGRWFWVQCNACKSRSSDRTTLEDAIADWNARGKRSAAVSRPARATKTRRRA